MLRGIHEVALLPAEELGEEVSEIRRAPAGLAVFLLLEEGAEVAASCMEALRVCEAVDLVQVVEHVDWRGVRIDGQGRGRGSPAAFPVPRGTVLPVGTARRCSGTMAMQEGSRRGRTSRAAGALRDRYAWFDMPATGRGTTRRKPSSGSRR